MRVSGLSVSIAVTFVLALGGALVLGLLVIVSFWQHNLVQGVVDRTQLVMRGLVPAVQGEDLFGSPDREAVLQELLVFTEGVLDGLVFYNGSEFLSVGSFEVSDSITQVVRSAGLRDQPLTSLRGLVWAVVSPGSRVLLVAHPLAGPRVPHGALAGVVELHQVYEQLRREVRLVAFYVLVNLSIFSVLGFYRMKKAVVRPIERMVKISESYSGAGVLQFGGGDGGSEFGRLSMALNSMLLRIELDRDELRRTVESLAKSNEDLRRAQQEVVRAEKFAAVGRLSAGLAHEIGNPLGIVQGYVELLRQPDLSGEDRRQFAERALAELNRIDRLIRRLLDFSRSRPRRKERFAVMEVLAELQEMFAAQARRAGVHLSVESGDEVFLFGDRDGLKQVFLNCLLNSFDAIEASVRKGAGRIVISVRSLPENNGGHWVTIIVRDNGVGFDVADRTLLFEPFYTTKGPGKGTGLGLSVSQAIIEAHGGLMQIDGERDGGATVTIELPVALENSTG